MLLSYSLVRPSFFPDVVREAVFRFLAIVDERFDTCGQLSEVFVGPHLVMDDMPHIVAQARHRHTVQ